MWRKAIHVIVILAAMYAGILFAEWITLGQVFQ